MLAAGLSLATAACSPPQEETGDRIDRIGGEELTDEQYERFVRRYAGVPAEEIDPAARQQLYEEYLAELLFARAAEREGLVAPAEAIREQLEALGPQAASEGDSREELERDARQAVLARLYEEKVLAPRIKVTDEEIDAALGAAPPRVQREFAVFRQIRVDSREAASEAYRRTVRRKEPFEAVAKEMSTAPDAGALQQRPLSNLPAPVADVLRKLPEGGISRPVEYDGAFYLFELEARNRDPDPGRAGERQRVADRLWSEKMSRLKEEELRRLAELEGIRTPRTARRRKEKGS